jgi:NTP pyrophosphatase (non-canonical NTP hydrolase)
LKQPKPQNRNVFYANWFRRVVKNGQRYLGIDKYKQQTTNNKQQTTNNKQQTTNMTIQAAQTQVDEWIKTVGVRYFNELTNLGILMEEVGELSRLMVRQYGEQSFKESDKGKELSDEMADVLWMLICLANQTGVDLTVALQKNFEKKNIRDINRHKENEKLQ